MTRTCMGSTSRLRILAGNVFVTTIALLLLGCAQPTFAQSQTKSFASASQAAQALYEAVKNENDRAVQAILGAGPELTSSGDNATDKLERERFAQKYQEMHRLVQEPDGPTALYIGAENWPFPIPLTVDNGRWRFDADAGSEEILARRIGEDETTVIEVCRGMTKAGGQGTEQPQGNDAIGQFERQLAAVSSNSVNTHPFQGYYFRVVREESGGVVLVAYPMEYRTSGVMTFIVTADGSVYEKDLGPKTTTVAQQIHGKPPRKWNIVQ